MERRSSISQSKLWKELSHIKQEDVKDNESVVSQSKSTKSFKFNKVTFNKNLRKQHADALKAHSKEGSVREFASISKIMTKERSRDDNSVTEEGKTPGFNGFSKNGIGSRIKKNGQYKLQQNVSLSELLEGDSSMALKRQQSPLSPNKKIQLEKLGLTGLVGEDGQRAQRLDRQSRGEEVINTLSLISTLNGRYKNVISKVIIQEIEKVRQDFEQYMLEIVEIVYKMGKNSPRTSNISEGIEKCKKVIKEGFEHQRQGMVQQKPEAEKVDRIKQAQAESLENNDISFSLPEIESKIFAKGRLKNKDSFGSGGLDIGHNRFTSVEYTLEKDTPHEPQSNIIPNSKKNLIKGNVGKNPSSFFSPSHDQKPHQRFQTPQTNPQIPTVELNQNLSKAKPFNLKDKLNALKADKNNECSNNNDNIPTEGLTLAKAGKNLISKNSRGRESLNVYSKSRPTTERLNEEGKQPLTARNHDLKARNLNDVISHNEKEGHRQPEGGHGSEFEEHHVEGLPAGNKRLEMGINNGAMMNETSNLEEIIGKMREILLNEV